MDKREYTPVKTSKILGVGNTQATAVASSSKAQEYSRQPDITREY
jgi:hypothetical protein